MILRILLLAFLFKSNVLIGQFEICPTDFNANLYDVVFINDTTVIAVGGDEEGSIFLRSIDSGKTWDKQVFTDTGWMYSISFVDDKIGFASGWGGVFYKTFDGGLSWELKHTGTNWWLWETYFLTPLKGFVLHFLGTMLITEDGGDSWFERSFNGNHFSSMYFLNDSIGFLVGGIQSFGSSNNQTYLRTEDAGESWNYFDPGTNESLNEVFFLNDSIGFTTGIFGTITKTIDSGNSWRKLSEDFNEVWYNDIHFVNENTGYIVTDGGEILNTKNEGESWDLIDTPVESILNSIHGNSNNVIAVGNNGIILSLKTHKISSIHVENNESIIEISPNPTHGVLTINLKHKSFKKAILYNDRGAKLYHKNIEDLTLFDVSLNDFESGLYFIQLIGKEKTISKKIIKL